MSMNYRTRCYNRCPASKWRRAVHWQVLFPPPELPRQLQLLPSLGSSATDIIQRESKILFQQEQLKQQRASCHRLWTCPGEAEMVCLMLSLITPGSLWLIKCPSFVTNSCWAQHLMYIYGWPVGCNNDWTIYSSPNHVNSFLCVPGFL